MNKNNVEFLVINHENKQSKIKCRVALMHHPLSIVSEIEENHLTTFMHLLLSLIEKSVCFESAKKCILFYYRIPSRLAKAVIEL
jgi:hypothetical protein